MAAANSAATCEDPSVKAADDVQGKVVFNQDGVFVHTAVSTATQGANIIPGIVTIIEKQNSTFVDWSPAVGEEEEFELESSDYSEWDLVTQSKQEDASVHYKKKRKSMYAIHFNVTELHSIRRSDPKLAWSYAVFMLKNGTTQPALHFHSGGISEMIRRLQRYIWITRSPHNYKLYVVAEEHSALKESLDHLQLFSEDNLHRGGPWQKLLHSAYYDGMDALSKVTRYVRDVYVGYQQGVEDTQGEVEENGPKKEHEFEDLGDVGNHSDEIAVPEKRDLGEVPEVTREEPMRLNEWQSFLDDAGRITDVKKLKNRIFHGGIDELIRKPVWQYLLGYKKYGYTVRSQQTLFRGKEEEYKSMKWQWQSMTKTHEKNFSEFRERKHLVAPRSDEHKPSPHNSHTLSSKQDILLTYCMYNFDLGYVQGMSDLLSPILFLMEDEVEAFWCFVGFMEKLAHNFDENQEGMKAQLHQLAVLLKFVDPHFYKYLEEHDSGNLYFCFRWLLICFKREFSFPDIMTLWETLWSQSLSPNYHLIVCLAILDKHRRVIMENNFGFTEILKYINDLAYNLDVQEVLVRAEQICVQLLAYPDLPAEVNDILTGKNEAMMTPNVEKTDPYLMAHNRHVVSLLEGCGLGKASSPLQTSNLTACDTDESIHVLPSENRSTEDNNETEINDLDRASARSSRPQIEGESNEAQMNDSDDEIVVLSEEAQNIF
ncbi:TBC1 domain family member 15 [Stylophora pistillata]|uniref:TBC1 domain family member 15 n=1 Tax=Stylophora pistillata TaxID=50429 RepID=A0A2B4SU95_STYPI|nr:TBC1 domain family member 15 [Stylophora pistillata]